MQLTMPLDVCLIQPTKHTVQDNLWIDFRTEAHLIGFTQEVDVSQQLIDALQSQKFEDEGIYEQRLYDALWLAHHYLSLDHRASFSFRFDFLQDDPIAGKLTERSIRLRLETHINTARLGLLNDF